MDIEPVKLARGGSTPEEVHEHAVLKFPPGFLWGSSTSAHQVEGGNDKNDWWAWEENTKHIADGLRSGDASGHYPRYKEDFSFAHSHHQNAHRLSIEWSRVEPVEGEWDVNELRHYREVLTELKKQFFTVMLTLNHFTLPTWVVSDGGWENAKTVARFNRFVKWVADELGDLVDLWVTVNEPMIYISQGYVYGVWPPGKKSIVSAYRVFRNLVRAHKKAYTTLHATLGRKDQAVRVGIAQNVISFEPYRRHKILDMWFVRFADRLWNHWFFSRTMHCHDFIGINYYFHYRVACVPRDYAHFFFQVRNENREVSDVGWEVYPSGIFRVIADMATYGKPIYITENGIAVTNDDKRIRFIVAHTKEIYHAIQAGFDVRGYFHWSLLDNFEWEKGFGPRFGLIEVDYTTMERTPRKSLSIYGEIAAENGIKHDLLRFMGHMVK